MKYHAWITYSCLLAAKLVLAGQETYKIRVVHFTDPIYSPETLNSTLEYSNDEATGTATIGGVFQQHTEMGDEWKFSFYVYLHLLNDNNQYHYDIVYAKQEMGICDIMDILYKEFFASRVQQREGLPMPNKFPVPSGKYEFHNYLLDVSLLQQVLGEVSEGDYMVSLEGFKINRKEINYVLFAEVRK